MYSWSKTNYAVFAIYLSAITFAVTATANSAKEERKMELNANKIYDISSNVTLYNRRILQLEVKWKDNLHNDTSYNVIVTALNSTLCPDMPCSVYGITKSKIKDKLLIPENPMSIVDVMECSYIFGCSYKLVVETSNAKISNNTELSIPYCVLNVCSCQHAQTLPKVQLKADIPSNNTINFDWTIKWDYGSIIDRFSKETEINGRQASIKLCKIYLRIGEQTNPSLSWGGKLIQIAEKVYSLENLSYTYTNNTLHGNVQVKTSREMTSKAVINIHSYIEDNLHCPGPENLIKIQVPHFNEPLTGLVERTFVIHSAWIIATIVFICAVLLGSLICLWRCKKQKQTEIELKNADNYLSTFAPDIEMEDNLNYVDKYVEEAQANGLADVFEVPHHAVELEVEIGEGAFGRVYKGVAYNLRRMRGATLVAVKKLKRNPTADEVGEFLFEIEMLKGVGTHNNIVCFLGCCTIRAPYLMIMEYVGRGDLLTYLRTVRQYASKPGNENYMSCKPIEGTKLAPVKYIELKMSIQSAQSTDSDGEMERHPKTSLAETTYTLIDDEQEFEYILDHKELHNFALQIANGMRFLEEQEITHRDLAARNVLIDDRKTLKISDFGLSRHGIYTNTKTRKLPLRWLSIEAIRDNIYSNKSDVWAYGVVLWEIGTLGASPYPTISNHELIPFLLAGKRLEKPEICTQQVYDIMLDCWHEDPDERPTFEKLFIALSPKTAYVDINSLSDDYVFPPIQGSDDINTNT